MPEILEETVKLEDRLPESDIERAACLMRIIKESIATNNIQFDAKIFPFYPELIEDSISVITSAEPVANFKLSKNNDTLAEFEIQRSGLLRIHVNYQDCEELAKHIAEEYASKTKKRYYRG